MPLTKRGGWPYANPPNTSFELNRQSPQSRGLVGWWPTVGAYGAATVHDLARGHLGALGPGADRPGWASSPTTGWALTFDGSDYVDCGAASDLAILGALTLSAWVYQTSAAAGRYYNVITNGSFYGADAPYAFGLRHDRKLYCHWRNAGTLYGTESPALITTLNAWDYICATRDAAYNLVLYVNGRVVATDGGNAAAGDGGHNTYLGLESEPKPFDFGLIGRISDPRIYNRALSAAEVWAMYNPATRWELYAPVISSGVVFVPGVSIPLFMHHYRQQRIGNGF